MKIVVLDGFTTAGYDLNFDIFKKYGEVVYYDETPKEKIVERAFDADIIISNKTNITAAEFDKLQKCRFIDLISTGFDALDVDYAGKKGIAVSNVPSYSENAVAQCTFSHILNIFTRLYEQCNDVRNDWNSAKQQQMKIYPMTELSGKTIGLFGFGKIARQVAKIALGFDMNVIATARHEFDFCDVRQVSFDELLSMSDIFSVHVPCTDETRGIINNQTIAKMKDGVVFINTARGAIADEQALANALKCGKISFCGLDVLKNEPPSENNELLKLNNCFITPHTAWAAKETRQRLIEFAEQNLKAFLEGKPQNIINNVKIN